MDIKRADNLKLDHVIRYSWYSPIVGALSIISWIVCAFFLYVFKEVPLFLFVVNLVCQLSFIVILVKQFKSHFQLGTKFLLGFQDKKLVVPINWQVKNPESELGLYLSLSASESQKIHLVHETRSIPLLLGGKVKTRVKTRIIESIFIEIHLNSEMDDDLFHRHHRVVTSEGFTGSPVCFPKRDIVQYYIDGNSLQEKNIFNNLKKYFPGAFEKEPQKRIFTLKSDEPDFRNKVIGEVRRLTFLGERSLADSMLNYYERDLGDQLFSYLKKNLEEFSFLYDTPLIE
ncbi:hypothetical protein [Desulforhopalus sp. 52FAK]